MDSFFTFINIYIYIYRNEGANESDEGQKYLIVITFT